MNLLNNVWWPMPIPEGITPDFIGATGVGFREYHDGAMGDNEPDSLQIFAGWDGPEFTDSFGTRKSGRFVPATHWLERSPIPNLP
jgi:hypothetical protein